MSAETEQLAGHLEVAYSLEVGLLVGDRAGHRQRMAASGYSSALLTERRDAAAAVEHRCAVSRIHRSVLDEVLTLRSALAGAA